VWPPTETRDEHESRERVELPNKKVIRQHLEAYQISIHGQLFPFLNPPCFEHTIRAAYDEELSDLSPSVKCARGCIFGFMAMASYLTVPPREDAIMSADKYAREVQDLLPDISREPVNLDGLQAVIMLVRISPTTHINPVCHLPANLSKCFCCTALSGDVFKMELLLSWAVRYIFHLKGNLYPTIAKGDHAHAKLHVRNLFWICFIQDKFFGLRTGLTPLFDPMNCELTLPGGEHGHCDPRSFHPSHQQKPSAFITLIRLSIVQSEIYRGLYSCPALRQSDAELLGTIRRLDSALEEWWSSVPVFTDDIHNDPTMADLLFKMQYHYCMAAIHQTSSRCTAWVRNQDTRAAGSSLAISIGASRAVLNRFLDTSPQLLGQFVMYVFHSIHPLTQRPSTPSTSLTPIVNTNRFCLPELTTSNIHLFSNILTNPLDRASWTDLELMRVTSRHVEDHLWQQAPASFTAQVRLAERFMGDLQRLASCAIVKAQRERGVDRVMGEG
jgi:hypothetical protein